MSTHGFNFEGGELLADMGATWFVAYKYYQIVDNKFMNWNNCSTTQMRIHKFNKTLNYHSHWLKMVLDMKDINLNKNKLGIKASDTKKMAQEIIFALNI